MMMLKRYSRLFLAITIIAGAITLVTYQLSRFAVDASLNSWHTGAQGYKTALIEQQRTGKPIALFFHTDWCSSCKNLRETVLSSNQFTQFSGKLIPVKINPETGLEERKIADTYGVMGYPTFLVITEGFRTVTPIRTRNNMDPEKFIASCKSAISS